MKIKEEIKAVGVHEAKSAYHKARLLVAISEKSGKFLYNRAKFLKRYIKELGNKNE